MDTSGQVRRMERKQRFAGIFTVDIMALPLDARVRPPGDVPEQPGVARHIVEDPDDPLLAAALPPDRVGRARAAVRRGERVFLSVHRDTGQVVGRSFLSAEPERDRTSGLHVRLVPGELYLYDTWVDEAWRGRKLGLEQVAWLLGWARDHGYSRVYIWVDRDNVPSRKVGERLGFVAVQRVRFVQVRERVGLHLSFLDRPRFGPGSTTRTPVGVAVEITTDIRHV